MSEENEMVQNSLRIQLDALTSQNAILDSQYKILQEQLRSNVSMSTQNDGAILANTTVVGADLSEKNAIIEQKDVQIKLLNEQVDLLNTQLKLFIKKTGGSDSSAKGAGPSAKRPRENDEQDQNINMDIDLTEFDETTLRNEYTPRIEDQLEQNTSHTEQTDTLSLDAIRLNEANQILNNIPDDAPLNLKMLEAVLLKAFVPVQRELGHLHDRMDNLEYKENTISSRNREIRNQNQDKYGQNQVKNGQTKQSKHVQINEEFPTLAQSKYRNTKVSYSSITQNKNNSQPRSTSNQRDASDRGKPAGSRPSESRFSNKTFAEMVANSKIKPNHIRNIRVIAEDESERNKISTDLLNSYVCQDVGISSINSRSKDFIVVKCKSEDDAKKLENTLRTQYGNKINISNVRDTDPKFKIIGVYLADQSPSQFILNLKEQNDFLKKANLNYAEHYSVPHKNGTYTNFVISCDVQTLRRVLEKGSVICGLDNKTVHEQIDILQCFNCQRFGHVAGTCKLQPCCKFCGLDHSSKLCGDNDTFKCSNCIRENKRGFKYNIGHKATDERCQVRAARISGLKEFASKN